MKKKILKFFSVLGDILLAFVFIVFLLGIIFNSRCSKPKSTKEIPDFDIIISPSK